MEKFNEMPNFVKYQADFTLICLYNDDNLRLLA